MATQPDRRSRKRLATRQTISTVATGMFMERGFDNVTVDEIAAAADVGRVTVFNHFPRKEDMFFDRDDEGRDLISETLRIRPQDVDSVEALRLLSHRLVAEKAPYVEFSPTSRRFIETIEASATLKSRAREIRDELTDQVALGMALCTGAASPDSVTYLAATMILAVWSAAFIEAHWRFKQSADTDSANAVFLALVDQGMDGVKAAMAKPATA